MFNLSRVFVIAFLLLSIMNLPVYAQEAKYPDELSAIVEQFPGSTVMSTQKIEDFIQAILAAKGKQANEIIDYYRSNLVNGGWKVETELDHGEMKTLVFSSSTEQFLVNMLNMDDGIMITLSLTKGE